MLLENKANKKKKSLLKELPYDVVGHGKHAKAIRLMLEVASKKKKREESKREEREESKHQGRYD